jgi:hypothetical protein
MKFKVISMQATSHISNFMSHENSTVVSRTQLHSNGIKIIWGRLYGSTQFLMLVKKLIFYKLTTNITFSLTGILKLNEKKTWNIYTHTYIHIHSHIYMCMKLLYYKIYIPHGHLLAVCLLGLMWTSYYMLLGRPVLHISKMILCNRSQNN